jgi:hypothetical protein
MTTYPYTNPEFDAFGWSTLSRAELAPAESHGLDYESARDATSRWFAVSSGNGNDGVSHMWPDYYCRCSASEAFDLAAAAMLSTFKPAGYQWAKDNMEVDGESDYTISAVICDPPDEGNGDQPEDGSDAVSWSEVNGAWCIIEVFPADDSDASFQAVATMICDRPAYSSLADCFDETVLTLARSV